VVVLSHTRIRRETRALCRVVITAVGRELLGFIWAIGIKVETVQKESLQRAA
jgi:hypothetical protein